MNNNWRPKITAVVPCRNEAKYIEKCIYSIISSDYPKELLEILIIDGLSDDGSRDLIQKYETKYSCIKLIDNPKKILATAWNLGISNGSGDVFFAMNAHAVIEPEFFCKAIDGLIKFECDAVGPVIITHPQDDNIIGTAIANAMSSPFGVGNSRFRVGSDKPMKVDTVHMGAYHRHVFDRVGYFNEELIRSQDIEFHKRMSGKGLSIILLPQNKIHYYTRSNVYGFVSYGFINGYWVTRPFCFGVSIARIRHFVPMIFVTVSIIGLLLGIYIDFFRVVMIGIFMVYIITAFFFGAISAYRNKSLCTFVLLPAVCAVYHITYGLGSLYGLILSFFSIRFWRMIFATK